jgi:hypothetical protein
VAFGQDATCAPAPCSFSVAFAGSARSLREKDGI